jgi:hypothetical protein
MTYGTVPDPDAEAARLKNEARSAAEETPAMQAVRQGQAAKADAEWQAKQTIGSASDAGSFLDRIAGWFRRK